MRRTTNRVLLGGVTLVGAVALVAAPASAHFCYNDVRSAQGSTSAAGSPVWMSFHDLAFEFTGLCDEGIAVLAEAGGVTPTTLIHTRSVMAGGTLKKAEGGTPAISHMDFAGIEAAFPAAAAACA